MEEEIWKNVDGYDGKYQVSNLGRVLSHSQKLVCKGNGGADIVKQYKTKFLKGALDRGRGNGNIYVIFSKIIDGKSVTQRFLLSRLVAALFIDNPNGYKYVTHLDGNKQNNRVDNLMWVERKKGGIKSRPIKCVTTGEVYPSVYECSRQLNINKSTLRNHALSGVPIGSNVFKFLDSE